VTYYATYKLDGGSATQSNQTYTATATDTSGEIFGSNLATATAGVSTSDLVNGYLPTALAGATVTIDGKPAYLVYASPAQINVEAPADSTTGTVDVTVKTAAGSSTVAVSMQAVMPGLFTWAPPLRQFPRGWSSAALIRPLRCPP